MKKDDEIPPIMQCNTTTVALVNPNTPNTIAFLCTLCWSLDLCLRPETIAEICHAIDDVVHRILHNDPRSPRVISTN